MNLEKIKKELYKQKPIAEFLFIRDGISYYDTKIRIDEQYIIKYKTLFFEIPIIEISNIDLTPTMDAMLLYKWLCEKPIIFN